MAYTKKTFQNGDILYAKDLNDIGDALESVIERLNALSPTTQSATTSAPTTQAPVVTTQAPTQAPTTQAPSVTYQNLVQNSNIVENAGVSTSVASTWTNDNLGGINEDSNIPNDSAGGRKMSSFNIPSWASSSGNVKLRPTFTATAGATYHVYFDVACANPTNLGDCLIDVSNTTSWQSVTITDADTQASDTGAPAQLSYQASVGTSVVRKHFIVTGTFANGDNLNINILYGSCNGTAVTMYFGRVQIATNPNAQYIETSGTIVE